MRSLSFFLNTDGSMPVLRLKYLLNVFFAWQLQKGCLACSHLDEIIT